MSWDIKAHGSAAGYFYRSIRQGDRIVKEYLGRGDEAEAVAREIEERRAEQEARLAARGEELARIAVAEQHLAELQSLANTVIHAVLTSAGCHNQKGIWRKKRR